MDCTQIDAGQESEIFYYTQYSLEWLFIGEIS